MSNNSDFLYFTIERDNYGDFSVKGHKKCTRGVMKGQVLPHFITSFPTYEMALENYPEAGGAVGSGPSFNHLPDDQEPPVGNRKMKSNGLYE